ncbi:hypothetical protein HWC92_gp26 [Flavobacterium phage vB_FspS_morran9-1]|uniref:Uncharacterized protein n=7 Tax=Lillamyvirus TaxID=2843418 RepID=A0A6B9LCI7_9CAUD|nr:hypothetical protein HWC92_gp26 [Flavobacterium phage vB_FspS_morran9-1]YP_009855164.1 hypothetical protein HWC95_gp28 [Flavobacterium phage vB_FspS_sniff9-1]YP_009855237.1 hypothetical protein HWC96_gp27 [Flavobacterium phage vB_FspS_snork6-1]QHB39488.1 hypothetical protein lillamy97_gp024 [Flavobacterium phage vB_FspS_lillamy9-7]QHB40310.1 hypothetical protein sniff92_gp026 [Flavobacterium phage vB_FspS_sniff9-2]QHB40455.1 hypothetical protein snork62_gp025 [Flavobacterium phage vB_FspS_s
MIHKLQQLIDRKSFVEKLANKLKVKPDTIEYYFRTKIPPKSIYKVEACLDLQLKLDKDAKQIEVKAWELV